MTRLPLPRNQPVATTAAALPVSRLGKPDTRLAEPCVGQGWVQNDENTTVAAETHRRSPALPGITNTTACCARTPIAPCSWRSCLR